MTQAPNIQAADTFLRHVHGTGPIIEEVAWADPEAVFLPLADQDGALWLDSSDTEHQAARYSFIACAPYDTQRFADWQAREGFAALNQALQPHSDLWDGLPAEIDAQVPPWRGGAAGLFGYDLAYGLEALPPNEAPFAVDELHVPALVHGLYDTVLAFDHAQRRLFIIATGLPEDSAAARSDKARSAIEQWKQRLVGVPSDSLPQPPAAADLVAPLDSNFTQEEFCTAVRDTVEAILAGDLFQANITQCFTTQLAAADSGFAFYRRLRRTSPAPFAAYCNFGGFALASASPERFLQAAEGLIETRPIKGTAPRHPQTAQDEAIAAALQASEKNRAENVMIVDLLRNDLAKSCEDASIKVPHLCRLESFSNVHHLVSTVQGRLADGKTALDALQAAFPGGSITGAPKIRSMQHIAEMESCRRGPSYGAIAWLGFDGAMDSNIIIRTAIVKQHHLRFHVGGGIVADSQPLAEYEETLNKARGLLAALGVNAADLTAAENLKTGQSR
ncbi:MAG: anthranilate synthase component I family protein [Parvibaculales bacterium]